MGVIEDRKSECWPRLRRLRASSHELGWVLDLLRIFWVSVLAERGRDSAPCTDVLMVTGIFERGVRMRCSLLLPKFNHTFALGNSTNVESRYEPTSNLFRESREPRYLGFGPELYRGRQVASQLSTASLRQHGPASFCPWLVAWVPGHHQFTPSGYLT